MARVERIEVRGVTRVFGSTAALRGVNATFEAGRVTVIEGPNGAGKSTLLAIVGTAVRPTHGKVRYPPLGSDPMEIRRHIGWLSHEPRLYGELSARQNIRTIAALYGLDARVAWERSVHRFEIEAFADQPVRTLSRGQKQRVALSRALLHAPSVVLLDEPSSGLDRASAERLESVVSEERERGAVLVVVSHDGGWADRIADARLRLQGGRVVSTD